MGGNTWILQKSDRGVGEIGRSRVGLAMGTAMNHRAIVDHGSGGNPCMGMGLSLGPAQTSVRGAGYGGGVRMDVICTQGSIGPTPAKDEER